MSEADWSHYVRSFLEEYFDLHPTFAAGAGRHDHDGRLPDWSPVGLKHKVSWMREQRERVLAYSSLEGPLCLEREHLLALIDADLFWMADADLYHTNPIVYTGPLDPALYLTRDYAPLERRMRAYIDYARAVPLAARQIRANLEERPLPRTFAQVGEMTLGGLAGYYEKDVAPIFAAVQDPALQEDLRTANAAAAEAMRHLGAWFAAQKEAAGEHDGGFALGPERYRRMLRDSEGVEVPLDVLEAAGRRELERNLAALREACAAYAPGRPIDECVAATQAEKPPEGPVEAARRQLADLRRFVEEKELASIPGDEQALIAEAPSYQRWNSAYIDIPGPYDRHLPSIYYITPPDPSWSPEEREAYLPGRADLLFVTIHEVWPGHFLQFLHSNRAASEVAQLFVSYGYTEGWAHYSEELMWEAGFGNGDPALRIGQLQNALLRNVRYLVALGLHTGGMTVAEAGRMFRELAFQDTANARQQAARGTFDPQFLNYTLGKLMIRKLRADWTARHGCRSDAPGCWRELHDRFLGYGGPPIPIVRRHLLGDEGSLL